MRYALRLSLPDRPGMLGALATALGAADVDIVALDVVERGDDITVDDVEVEAGLDGAALRAACEAVGGVVVEALVPVRAADEHPSELSLAATVAEAPGDSLEALVAGLPGTLGAAWAAAVTQGPAGLEVLAASSLAPAVPAGARLPFLPLEAPRRFPQAQWMPTHWRADPGDRLELAGVPLGGPVSFLLLTRVNGPRFRPAELQRLWELGRVALAAGHGAAVAAGV